MEGLDLPNIISGSAIGLVVIALSAIGFMKGSARMFFGLIALCAAALIAYWGFKRGGAIAGYIISEPDSWMSGAVGIILGLAVFFAARAIFGLVIKPTKVHEGKKQNNGGLGALFGLISGLVLSWFVFSSARYVGTLTEFQWIKSCLAEEDKITKAPQPLLVQLRDLLDGTIIGSFHRQYDPLNSPVRAEIAKLRILTEHPYAITQVKVDNGVRAALRQSDIRDFLMKSPDLSAFIKESKFDHLIESPSIHTLSAIPAAQEALTGLDITKALGIEPEKKEKPKKEKKKEPVDPNAPKSGSARIY